MILKEMIVKAKLNDFKKQNNNIKTMERWKNLTSATEKLITYIMVAKQKS